MTSPVEKVVLANNTGPVARPQIMMRGLATLALMSKCLISLLPTTLILSLMCMGLKVIYPIPVGLMRLGPTGTDMMIFQTAFLITLTATATADEGRGVRQSLGLRSLITRLSGTRCVSILAREPSEIPHSPALWYQTDSITAEPNEARYHCRRH